jgi:hypothetical protein
MKKDVEENIKLARMVPRNIARCTMQKNEEAKGKAKPRWKSMHWLVSVQPSSTWV